MALPMQPTLTKVLLAWVSLTICTSPFLGADHNQPNRLDAAADFLAAHNQARAEVGVGPLHWDQKMAGKVGHLVRKACKFTDPTHIENEFGFNQAWNSDHVSPQQAVDSWVLQKKYYNHAKNSCTPKHLCGLYTQVVWNRSLELGCAQNLCGQDGTFTLCLYSPPGNIVGEKPY